MDITKALRTRSLPHPTALPCCSKPALLFGLSYKTEAAPSNCSEAGRRMGRRVHAAGWVWTLSKGITFRSHVISKRIHCFDQVARHLLQPVPGRPTEGGRRCYPQSTQEHLASNIQSCLLKSDTITSNLFTRPSLRHCCAQFHHDRHDGKASLIDRCRPTFLQAFG